MTVEISRFAFDNDELADHDRDALLERIESCCPDADDVHGVVNEKGEYVIRAEYKT